MKAKTSNPKQSGSFFLDYSKRNGSLEIILNASTEKRTAIIAINQILQENLVRKKSYLLREEAAKEVFAKNENDILLLTVPGDILPLWALVLISDILDKQLKRKKNTFSYCRQCGKKLRPAPARWDGEPTYSTGTILSIISWIITTGYRATCRKGWMGRSSRTGFSRTGWS